MEEDEDVPTLRAVLVETSNIRKGLDVLNGSVKEVVIRVTVLERDTRDEVIRQEERKIYQDKEVERIEKNSQSSRWFLTFLVSVVAVIATGASIAVSLAFG